MFYIERVGEHTYVYGITVLKFLSVNRNIKPRYS